MRTPLLFGAVVALFAPAAVRAERAPVAVGARLGYASAFGDAASGVAMKELTLKAQVPVQLEATAPVWQDLAVGPYLSYGFGEVDGAALSGACDMPGVSCSGHAWRLGALARWTFSSVTAPVVPWVGAALGWEWGSIESRDALGASSLAVNGWELGLEAGSGWRVSPRAAIGPYLQVGVGRYRSRQAAVDGVDVGSGAISDKAFHGWIGLGVAGRLDV